MIDYDGPFTGAAVWMDGVLAFAVTADLRDDWVEAAAAAVRGLAGRPGASVTLRGRLCTSYGPESDVAWLSPRLGGTGRGGGWDATEVPMAEVADHLVAHGGATAGCCERWMLLPGNGV